MEQSLPVLHFANWPTAISAFLVTSPATHLLLLSTHTVADISKTFRVILGYAPRVFKYGSLSLYDDRR